LSFLGNGFFNFDSSFFEGYAAASDLAPWMYSVNQFDADGNFIDMGEPEHSSEDIKINYNYKSDD